MGKGTLDDIYIYIVSNFSKIHTLTSLPVLHSQKHIINHIFPITARQSSSGAVGSHPACQ